MFCKLSPLIKNSISQSFSKLHRWNSKVLCASYSSTAKSGFIVMYKKEGQTIDDLLNQIEQKMDIRYPKVVENLDPEHKGLVTFACGKSKSLVPYLKDQNCYTISLKGVDSEHTLARRDFIKAVSCFIGESRQKRLIPLDEIDPNCYVIYSTPIRISDITVKKYVQTPVTTIDMVVRCDQGCDIATLINDIEHTLKPSLSFTIESCLRDQHCGLKDSSPLCIDSEDIDAIEYVHSSVAPWFLINNMTMLQHLSVAYFKEIRLFKELKERHSIDATLPAIEYFEHWEEDQSVPMKPLPSVPLILITPPQKTARPIRQGRKFKTEINPAMFAGIGRIERKENLVLTSECFTFPTPITILNTEHTKSSNYFHKARKNKVLLV